MHGSSGYWGCVSLCLPARLTCEEGGCSELGSHPGIQDFGQQADTETAVAEVLLSDVAGQGGPFYLLPRASCFYETPGDVFLLLHTGL